MNSIGNVFLFVNNITRDESLISALLMQIYDNMDDIPVNENQSVFRLIAECLKYLESHPDNDFATRFRHKAYQRTLEFKEVLSIKGCLEVIKVLQKIPENFDADFIKIVQIELIIRTTLEALEGDAEIFQTAEEMIDMVNILSSNVIQSKTIWKAITNEFMRFLMTEKLNIF